MTIDLTEEAKQHLTGSGTISIEIWGSSYVNTSTEVIEIPHNGNSTTSAIFTLSLDQEDIDTAGVQNEKYIRTDFYLDTEETESGALSDYQYVGVFIHGEEYNVVKNYLEKEDFSLEKDEFDLIHYNISEEYFLDFYNKYHIVGDETGFSSQFEQDDYPGGLSDCVGPMTAYDALQYGFSSCEEQDALFSKYREAGRKKNFSFSAGSQVPVKFFFKHLSKFQDEDSDVQDYLISSLYNKRQGKKMLEKAGLDKKIIIQKLKNEYGVESFQSTLPHVLLNIGKTIMNPETASEKPLAIYVRTKQITEGTYSDKRLLSSLAKTHNIVLVQVDVNDSDSFDKILNHIKETFPPADLLVMSSHGGSDGMEFININDTELFNSITQVLKPEATVFLSACGTAERRVRLPDGPFAYVLSNALPGRTIIAAKDNTYAQYLKYNPSAQDASRRYTAYMKWTPIAVIKNGKEQDFIK